MAAIPAAPFGALLRHHRLAAGLSQQELADRAGVSVRAISDLERGVRRSPYPHTVRQLARALGLRAADRARLMEARRMAETDPPGGGRGTPVLTNLPAPITSFIGREQELTDVTRLLGTTRLLTLTGAGGVGKTRLALEAARAVQGAYPDGVWLVELAALAEGALAPAAVAQGLGVVEQPDQPLTETLLVWLAGRRLLLVLDNCEHLIEACAALVDTLLRGCPGLTLLATSREAIGIGGELTWRVPSLTLPDPRALPSLEHPRSVEAIALFIERARSVRPDLVLTERTIATVAQICQRLDGIPLAIELAAARVAVLSVAQLATRLDDQFRLLTSGSRAAPARQQTLRATLDWSWNLLAEPERVLLRRLAVFAGGWTLEAAEAVCAGALLSARPAALDMLDILARLVAKSLVQVEGHDAEARYRLLEPVRQYALERLQEADEAGLARRQHAACYLALAEAAAPRLIAPGYRAWFARLAAEHDNLRSALRWAEAWGDPETNLRLAGALTEFWWARGHLSEGIIWLERALARSDAPTAGDARPLQVARAWALHGAGILRRGQGDYATARARLLASLTLFEALGDECGQADAIWGLGSVTRWEGDPAAARPLLERSLMLYQKLGQASGIARAFLQLTSVALAQDDYVMARRYIEAGMAAYDTIGYQARISLLELRAEVAILEGDYATARSCLRTALELIADMEGMWLLHRVLDCCATLAAAEGRPWRALCLVGAAAAVRERIGAQAWAETRPWRERLLAPARRALGEHDQAIAWEAGHVLTPEQAVAEALAMDALPVTDTPAQPPTPAGPLAPLSAREAEVAALVARGFANAEIAARLSIAERTAQTHVSNILGKLGLSNRARLAVWAVAQGLAPASRPE